MRKTFRWFRRCRRRAPVPQRIPILAYHGANAHGYDYATNDHRALESDLATARKLGFRVATLRDVVDFVLGRASTVADGRWLALTFDDAPDVDWFDFVHPDVGCLKSFHRIVVEDVSPPSGGPAAVSFAIASDEARAALDRECLAGRGHWRSHWWADASDSGIIGIANHSYDHAHPAVPVIRQRAQRKGTFLGIDNERDADAQVAHAQRILWFRTGGNVLPYFAYPYGQAPDYLVNDYFPRFASRHRIEAAFDTAGTYATAGCNRWRIPRFVCGEHWRSPDAFAALLEGAVAH